ncbi:hypothetical protein NM208_g11308 [Fusarium decemcellulare]|uniref:Uncharacterized protein n=1 Tax=Fusarium decemcellulare TaxID=57161 RepID=A0ACC1RTL4_9HYPO|nr:hypothetical protein NM208_g11308 [Fusarium decemcellulare]
MKWLLPVILSVVGVSAFCDPTYCLTLTTPAMCEGHTGCLCATWHFYQYSCYGGCPDDDPDKQNAVAQANNYCAQVQGTQN